MNDVKFKRWELEQLSKTTLIKIALGKIKGMN